MSINWKEYFDDFSNLPIDKQRLHLQTSVDQYREVLEYKASRKIMLYSLLDFIGSKSEKRKEWSIKLKEGLDELDKRVTEIMNEQSFRET